MSRRHALNRLFSLFVVLSLVLTSFLPALAQDTTIFLPLTGNPGSSTGVPLGPFRTQVTVNDAYHWQVLGEIGVLLLDKGDDWATVLADDGQLEKLAKWGYRPERTMDWMLLQAASGLNTPGMRAVGAASSALRAVQAADGAIWASADEERVTSAETSALTALQSAVAALSSAEVLAITQADDIDTDGDGLTDTQEGYWCTNIGVQDSDFDGVTDGQEVAAIKAWMFNERSGPPSTAQPFNGWTEDIPSCLDNDRDSIPNLAERFELGLNMNRESTDRDKFDDGQEVFGVTYCPGSGTACGYGSQPPASLDGIVLFPEMPSWVKAPGNHPLVAAYPVPEIDIVESSFHVQTVTAVTTDHAIAQGTEKSLSTSRTEGTSTTDTETRTWNIWEEVSIAKPQTHARRTEYISWGPVLAAIAIAGASAITFCAGWQAIGVGDFFDNPKLNSCGGVLGHTREWMGSLFSHPEISFVELPPDLVLNPNAEPNMDVLQDSLRGCYLDQVGNLKCEPIVPPNSPESAEKLKSTMEAQDKAASEQDRSITASNSGQPHLSVQNQLEVAFRLSAPPTIRTDTKGSSVGGAVSTSTENYEEHTITNGEAFSSEESWGTATAVDSAHAADLWFTYKVRNTGNEYAREIAKLAFNIYIGDDPNPACTYYLTTGQCGVPGADSGVLFQNFMPNEEHTYTSSRIPLSLEQMKAIEAVPNCTELRQQGIVRPFEDGGRCPGGPIRIVVEDYSYGIDELFYQDAAASGITIALEDGTADSDELINTYLLSTWGTETVLQVIARYFPHETDANGMMTAIWTPEYGIPSGIPSWCQSGWRPTDQPTKALWCKHTLSAADWWNVYTDGMGDGSQGFQSTQAVPGATALFRFNQDSDLDGFSDRSEFKLGTDPGDAASFPQPELLAGVHNIRSGNRVTSTLSLLNTGPYDAYGIEAIMVAPDDSVTIDNNTVGGSGRVRALDQVIVGSRILLQAPLPAAWSQANHALPVVGGYFTGDTDRTYTFTVASCPVGGCTVGSGAWALAWSDSQGITGRLNFAAEYASPTFTTVGSYGMTLALRSGTVQNGESFTVAANTPRDTFQYTINRTPFTEPVVIVSYNDPQGNHRFVLPSQAMSLTAPGSNLQALAGQMLEDVGVEIVTSQPFTSGVNSVDLLVNNPSDKSFTDAHLFLEFINVTGTVVSEVAMPVALPPGPGYHPVSFSSGDFDPAFNPADDYIVMAFLTDYQGNILDTAGRPLSSFQADPLPQLAVNQASLTWDFGTVEKGALLKHPLGLANVGYGALYTYLSPTPGLSLSRMQNGSVGAADTADFGLTLHTAELSVGAYDQMVTLQTSDPLSPTVTVHVVGSIAAATGNIAGSSSRPLDVPVTVQGPQNQGDWVTFIHNLGPEPQTLHPVKVYSQDYR